MYIKRTIEPEIQQMALSYPVVTITGPRQSGKTTVAQHVFKEYPYINLEAPDIVEEIRADPRRFLRTYRKGVILDEIQRLPELLSYIQITVDEDKKMGQFILTGSHQMELENAISQSLAGRTAILKLLPLNLEELKNKYKNLAIENFENLIFFGFYPRIYDSNLDPTKFYRDYVATYLERDVKQLINIKNISLFRKFLKLCVGRIGQIFNANNLSNEVGVSSHTIQSWISILQAMYIIFLLPPYFENFGKRAIKSPKLYFVDSGLACYLLGINKPEQIERDPLRGSLFENLVISEIYKMRYNQGINSELYFFRDNNQKEIDLIIPDGRQLLPIEIKASETFSKQFITNLEYFNNLTKPDKKSGLVIYSGEKIINVKDYKIINYKKLKAFL